MSAGLASICLLYMAGRRIFGSAGYGLLTASLFALTPLLWLQLRDAPASLYPLPFVAGWLLAVAHLDDRSATWWAVLAGGLLGLGMYSSLAGAVMMPLYLLLTLAILGGARAATIGQLALCVGAFAVSAAPLAFSVVLHPEAFRQAITAHRLYDAHRFNILQGAHEMISWVGLTARSEMYYDYFSPSFLFLTGRVLLFPCVVLLPAGLYRILIRESTPLSRLALAGFLAAPFAAALTAERPLPGRILFLTTFAAVVSAYGVRQLLSLRARAR